MFMLLMSSSEPYVPHPAIAYYVSARAKLADAISDLKPGGDGSTESRMSATSAVIDTVIGIRNT